MAPLSDTQNTACVCMDKSVFVCEYLHMLLLREPELLGDDGGVW